MSAFGREQTLETGRFRPELLPQRMNPASGRAPRSTAPKAIMKAEKRMDPKQVTIEDWDGYGAIRIPDEALQELGVDVRADSDSRATPFRDHLQ